MPGRQETPVPRTPDGRYIIVRDRLWRATNPSLSEAESTTLRKQLMQARRDVATAKRTADETLMKSTRRRVQKAKVALGERGPVWWDDAAPDLNRHMIQNTPYAQWWLTQKSSDV